MITQWALREYVSTETAPSSYRLLQTRLSIFTLSNKFYKVKSNSNTKNSHNMKENWPKRFNLWPSTCQSMWQTTSITHRLNSNLWHLAILYKFGPMKDLNLSMSYSGMLIQFWGLSTIPQSIMFYWDLAVIEVWFCMILGHKRLSRKSLSRTRVRVWRLILLNHSILLSVMMTQTVTASIWEKWTKPKQFTRIISVLSLILTSRQQADNLSLDLLTELSESLSLTKVAADKFITPKECKLSVQFHIPWTVTMYCQALKIWTLEFGKT